MKLFSSVLIDYGSIQFKTIFFLVIAAVLLILAIQKGLPRLSEKLPSRFRRMLLPSIPVLRLAVIAFAIIEIAPLLIKPTPQNLLAMLGSFAVAFGFAIKDYVSSLVAGIVAVYEKPYRIGDWVNIDGVYGEVRSLGMRALTVCTPDDTMVTIPHGKIWSSNIQNANDGDQTHLCVTNFFLHPLHNGSQVRSVMLDVVLTSPYLKQDRPWTVVVSEEPWCTHYRVKAYPVHNGDEFQFITDITIRGKEALNSIGASPALTPPSLSGQGSSKPFVF